MAVVRFTALFGLIVVTAAACATTGAEPPLSSSATTTMMYGWERHFTLEWTAEPERGRVSGYLQNRNGEIYMELAVVWNGTGGSAAAG